MFIQLVICTLLLLFLYVSFKKQYIRFMLKKEKKGLLINKVNLLLLSILTFPHQKIKIYRSLEEEEEFPITNKEIRELLKIVYQKNPLAVLGVKKIFIRQRNIDERGGIRASYTPKGFFNGEILLLPFQIDENGHYLHGYTSKKDGEANFLYADKELTRMAIINSFLHELGHHYRYNMTGELIGDHVEEYCDHFSTQLGKELNLSPGVKVEEELVEQYDQKVRKEQLKQLREETQRQQKRIKELEFLVQQKEGQQQMI